MDCRSVAPQKKNLSPAGRLGGIDGVLIRARIPKAPGILKIDKQWLGLPDGTFGVAFLAAVAVLRSSPAEGGVR